MVIYLFNKQKVKDFTFAIGVIKKFYPEMTRVYAFNQAPIDRQKI